MNTSVVLLFYENVKDYSIFYRILNSGIDALSTVHILNQISTSTIIFIFLLLFIYYTE